MAFDRAAAFQEIAARLERPEQEILERIAELHDAAVISRLGVIVRHRALDGVRMQWLSGRWSRMISVLPGRNWPGFRVLPFVTNAKPAGNVWPYRLYCMIHGRSRSETLEVLQRARTQPELAGVPHKVLFSVRCFKQTGAMITKSLEGRSWARWMKLIASL